MPEPSGPRGQRRKARKRLEAMAGPRSPPRAVVCSGQAWAGTTQMPILLETGARGQTRKDAHPSLPGPGRSAGDLGACAGMMWGRRWGQGGSCRPPGPAVPHPHHGLPHGPPRPSAQLSVHAASVLTKLPGHLAPVPAGSPRGPARLQTDQVSG